MGRKKDYFADRALTDADRGRFNVTKNDADRHRFKTPTLRNIALTAPYLHDGSTSDLSEVILIMAEYQAGRTMSSQQVTAVEAFLNAQTGEYQGVLLQ
jgi:cytochrome c peroxidase